MTNKKLIFPILFKLVSKPRLHHMRAELSLLLSAMEAHPVQSSRKILVQRWYAAA